MALLLTCFAVPKWFLKLLACSYAIAGVCVALNSVGEASDGGCEGWCFRLALNIPASLLYLIAAIIIAKFIPPYDEAEV